MWFHGTLCWSSCLHYSKAISIIFWWRAVDPILTVKMWHTEQGMGHSEWPTTQVTHWALDSWPLWPMTHGSPGPSPQRKPYIFIDYPALYLDIIHRESKKGATLTMAITLSILDRFAKFFTAANSSKFPTKLILGYPPHLKYVAALPWKT